MDRKGSRGAERKEEIERLMAEKYEVTVHVDQKSVFRVDSRTKQFDECRLSGNPETWSSEVLNAVGQMDRPE